jgi:hypothetical protein
MIDPRLAMPTFLATIAITFVTGGLGNHWYRKQVNALAADQSLGLAELEQKGGVSVPAVWISVAATVLLIILSGALAVMRQPGPAPLPSPAPAPAAPATAGDKPAEGGQAAAAPATFDASFFVGRWSDEGNCKQPLRILRRRPLHRRRRRLRLLEPGGQSAVAGRRAAAARWSRSSRSIRTASR